MSKEYLRGYETITGDRRKEILERDNFTCQDCGAKDCKLEVHHILPYRMGGEHTDENLITLCRPCHFKAEKTVRVYKTEMVRISLKIKPSLLYMLEKEAKKKEWSLSQVIRRALERVYKMDRSA